MNFEELKSQWNAVLDDLLNTDRIAWLAYFDARLVSLDGSKLTLSFADSEKFGGDHNYKSIRKPEHTAKIQSSIKRVTGKELEVVE
jgi:hypothetical protein